MGRAHPCVFQRVGLVHGRRIDGVKPDSMLRVLLGRLRDGPLLRHEIEEWSNSQVHQTVFSLNELLAHANSTRRIVGRWVHSPGTKGLRVRERLYEMVTEVGTPCHG